MVKPSFATFWAGPSLSGWEAACIASFTVLGHEMTVYSYGEIAGLPLGVRRGDARAITDEGNLIRFLIKGRPNLAHFSDLFRYELFQHTRHIWVDADMMLLQPFELDVDEDLLAREDPTTLCNAIMRLRAGSDTLARIIAETLALRDREIPWGATGPQLLTRVFGRQFVLAKAHSPQLFFPIHYEQSWKLLLPVYRDECEAMCAGARTVHLWNDRITKIGVWKRFGPPAGSYLETTFRKMGMMDRFDDCYPESIMEAMTTNWRFRIVGGDIGLGQWIRHALPSARMTYRRWRNLPV